MALFDALKPYWLMIKIGLLIALSVALFGSGYWLRNLQAQRDDAKRVASELTQFQKTAAQINGVSDQIETALQTLRASGPQIIKDYNDAVLQNPLPADCAIDDSRLRSIQSSIDAANAAGQSGDSVSSHP
jgi:hypothetical protein